LDPAVYLLIATANLVLMIWFIVTLNQIKRYTRDTAEYARRLALAHPPTKEQARLINDDLSPPEILARLADSGARVKLKRGPQPAGPLGLDVENAGAADPELLRLLEVYRTDIIKMLLRAESHGNA
jgi:hypothetical protein